MMLKNTIKRIYFKQVCNNRISHFIRSFFSSGKIRACIIILFSFITIICNVLTVYPAEHQDAQGDSPTQDIPYDILADEDTSVKRQSRLHGERMHALYGPQAIWHSSFIESDDEVGSRNTIGATMPLSDIWEIAVLDHINFFSLKDENKNSARESIDLRIGMSPGRNFRPWLTLTPYFNFGEAEGGALGVSAGFNNIWRNGATLSMEVYAWRPWDEGYSTIIEDGRKYGVNAEFDVPVTKNFLLFSRGYYEELELGDGSKSGAQYAGNRYEINARAYYRLLQSDDAFMSYGFRSDDLWNEFLVGSEVGIFINIDYQRYFKPDGFHAINPISDVFAQEIGLSFQYAISPRLGITGEGFVGRDPDRDLQFGELYGLLGRVELVATPHLRLWAGASYLETNTSLLSSGGQETTISVGINYVF